MTHKPTPERTLPESAAGRPGPIRALIAEDEPLARATLVEFLGALPGVECVAEAEDGPTAVRLIDELLPDLVFLDVRMPGLSGLEVLERIRHEPAVVFTTAYDRYAATAFELGAIDYLVKPFGQKRFDTTVERVRRRLAAPDGLPTATHRARSALGDSPLRRLFARVGDSIFPIAVEDVVRLEARGDYVAVHAGGQTRLLHVTLAELEGRLDGERFRRVHRSHMVNLDHVLRMRTHDDRRLLLSLDDGTELLASRTGSQRLRESFG